MENQFSRTELLIGQKGLEKLFSAKVIVFGVGGVGGFVVEALARAGVGEIALVDNDVVSLSNINRQIIATHDTVGMDKVEVCKTRILSINPNCKVNVFKVFFDAKSAQMFDLSKYDYVVDAIDSVSSKLLLIEQATASNTKIVSAMGAGNKLDPTKFEVCDIFQTSVCPLARVMRQELKKRNIKSLKVVYSKETPQNLLLNKKTESGEPSKKMTTASISFVPSVAGLILAGEVVKDLLRG